jgi:hypothetical protein
MPRRLIAAAFLNLLSMTVWRIAASEETAAWDYSLCPAMAREDDETNDHLVGGLGIPTGDPPAVKTLGSF